MPVALVKSILKSADPTVDDASVQMVLSCAAASDFSFLSACWSHLDTFWNVVPPVSGVHPISNYISEAIDRGASVCEFVAYDITGHLNGTPHGSPVALHTWTLGPAGTSAKLPEGVAATLSFRADYGTDVEFGSGTRPRARDRNRFYIGPLTQQVLSSDTAPKHSHFTSDFMDDCLLSFVRLCANLSGLTPVVHLSVWSRKNAALKIPEAAWMDDRPDYQRRRSDPNPGSKITVPIVELP